MSKKILFLKICYTKWLLNSLLKFLSPRNRLVIYVSQYLDKSIVIYQSLLYKKYKIKRSSNKISLRKLIAAQQKGVQAFGHLFNSYFETRVSVSFFIFDLFFYPLFHFLLKLFKFFIFQGIFCNFTNKPIFNFSFFYNFLIFI